MQNPNDPYDQEYPYDRGQQYDQGYSYDEGQQYDQGYSYDEGYSYNQEPQYVQKKDSYGMVLGVLSIIFFLFSSFVGLILGIIGLVRSKRNENTVVPTITNTVGIVMNLIKIVAVCVICAIAFNHFKATSDGRYGADSAENVITKYWEAYAEEDKTDARHCYPASEDVDIEGDRWDGKDSKNIDIKSLEITKITNLKPKDYRKKYDVHMSVVVLYDTSCEYIDENGDQGIVSIQITVCRFGPTWYVLEVDDPVEEPYIVLEDDEVTTESEIEATTEATTEEVTESTSEEETEATTEADTEVSSEEDAEPYSDTIGNDKVGYLDVDLKMKEGSVFSINTFTSEFSDEMEVKEYVNDDGGFRVVMYRFENETADEAVKDYKSDMVSFEENGITIDYSDETIAGDIDAKKVHLDSFQDMDYYFFDYDGKLYHIEFYYTDSYADKVKTVIDTFHK